MLFLEFSLWRMPAHFPNELRIKLKTNIQYCSYIQDKFNSICAVMNFIIFKNRYSYKLLVSLCSSINPKVSFIYFFIDQLNGTLCLVSQLYPTLCHPMDCSPPGFSVHGDSQGKNTGVSCHALLQGIFPTQGLNPGLLHCR